MADLQKYFENFHQEIRADYDMNTTLREKRDIIVDRIQRHLKENDRPGFTRLLQGSYRMGTGIKPISDLEYDIDVGLRFDVKDTDHEAAIIRGWVFEAVDGHTEKIEEKGPCIRVTYAKGYHVDLVVYAAWTDDVGNDTVRLAHRDDGWLPADPQGLLDHVNEARKPFDGTEDGSTNTDQFRRTVRYLKRWNDIAIPEERRDKPSGLAYTLLSCEKLLPSKAIDLTPDDRTALADFAKTVGYGAGRVVAKKPTPQYEDMFERLSAEKMEELKERFRTLGDILNEAGQEPDPVEACKKLRTVFGDDFPVPDPEDTGKKSSAPAIITSSSSA